MKKIYRQFLTIGLAFFYLLTLASPTEASELKFSVVPIIPENQIDKQKTYFDLKVIPETEQTLVIQLKNDTDQVVIVEPTVKTATTNVNGVVEYGKSNSEPDETIKHKIENLVKPEEKEVEIPAHGTSDLHLKVTIPKEGFDGVLAGGITLKEKEEEGTDKKEEKAAGQNLAIENKYAYVVAIVLKENDTPVVSKLTLNKVEPTQVNSRNAIAATIQNTQPKYMNKLKITAKVMPKGKAEVLYESETEDMQMAPNTSFSYPITLQGKELKPGKYTLDLVAESKGEKWHFTEDFEIEKDVANELNKLDVTIKKDNMWLYIAIGIVLLLIAVAIVIYMIRRKLKAKEREVAALRNEMQILAKQEEQE